MTNIPSSILSLFSALAISVTLLGCVDRSEPIRAAVEAAAAESPAIKQGKLHSPPVVVYIERVEYLMPDYSDMVHNLLEELFNARDVSVLFWPGRISGDFESWVGRDKAEVLSNLSEVISHGSKVTDPTNFCRGLDVCVSLAAKIHGDLIIVDRGAGTEYDYGDAKQRTAISEASRKVIVHVVSLSPDEPTGMVKYLSGQMIAVYQGRGGIHNNTH